MLCGQWIEERVEQIKVEHTIIIVAHSLQQTACLFGQDRVHVSGDARGDGRDGRHVHPPSARANAKHHHWPLWLDMDEYSTEEATDDAAHRCIIR